MRLLIEARPGAGKTTAARRLAELLRDSGVTVRGVLTEELRESGRRVGFSIEALTGERGTLAHVDLPGPPRVGRYGVDLRELERIALPALERPPDEGIVLIDELGKMELASRPFREAVEALLEGEIPLVATVQAARHPFTDTLKTHPSVETVRLTSANRDELPGALAAKLVQAVRRR